MGLSLESLLASFLVGTIGMGLFMYGKKQARAPQLVVGVALMAYPMFVTSAVWILVIAAALIAGLWTALRTGAL